MATKIFAHHKLFQDERPMTREEVADFIGCSKELVSKYAKRGKLPAFKIGREYRFLKSEILKCLKEATL